MKRGFSARHEWLFGSSIALSIQQGDARLALETAERACSRALLDLLATREVGAQPPTALAAAKASAPITPPGNPAEADRSTLTARASGAGLNPRGQETASSGGAGERRTAADLPRIDSSTAVRAATVPDMIATARRLRSTMLVYWITPDALYIWTIAPHGAVHDARVDVPMARVIGLVAATRAPASQDPAAGLFALKAASSRRPWRELHDLLIAPVRAHLPKTPDALITIVPHGPLAQLSFAALQDEQGQLSPRTLHAALHAGRRRAGDTAKRQERAASAGWQFRQRGKHRRFRQRHERPARRRLAPKRRTQQPRTRRRLLPAALLVGDPGELPSGLDGTPLSALPWARREVTDVAALLGGGATVLTDAQASEAGGPRTSVRPLDSPLRDARRGPRRRDAGVVPRAAAAIQSSPPRPQRQRRRPTAMAG